MRSLSVEQVMLDPDDYFETPDDLLAFDGFTMAQKRKILKCWELDVKLLQICDEENMSCSIDTQMLRRIHQALVDIEKQSTKH